MVKIKSGEIKKNLSKLELVEVDACVGCGECLNWCPIQDATGDPTISPPAKIKQFRDFLHSDGDDLVSMIFGKKTVDIDEKKLEHFIEGVYTCTTCGNCGDVCETGIHTQRLWWTLRKKIVDLGYSPPGAIPDLLKNTKQNRNIYNQPLDERYKIYMPPDVKVAENAEVGFFDGCGLVYTAAPMPEGDVRIMDAVTDEFTMLDAKDAWCCGYPITAAGMWEIQEELTRNNVEKLVEKGVQRLIVSCPCCLTQIRATWPKYYKGKLPFEVEHIIPFAVEAIEDGKLEFTKKANETVTFHDPCQLARGLKGPPVHDVVRTFISYLPGVKFVEMERNKGNTRCCGAGGAIRLFKGDTAMEMGKLLFRDAEATGAQTLLMNCPACYAMYVHRRIPPPAGIEWKAYKTKIKCNDLMQYATRLL